jgi:hypothetical protein
LPIRLFVVLVAFLIALPALADSHNAHASRVFVPFEPSRTIELSGEVSFEEALVIIRWFRDDAGAQFSDDEKQKIRQLSWRAAVGKDDAVYTLRVGDPYCECVLAVDLAGPEIGSEKDQFALVGKPQFVCPRQPQTTVQPKST